MAGTKRSADDAGPNTRASKAAKTDKTTSPPKSKKGGKKGAKAAIPTSAFKAKALPLHINVTHTPPKLPDADGESTENTDTGLIGTLTLVPSSFSTGSYGWKGSKRITVELQNGDGGDEKEKVQVMLTINATVVGSKSAEGEDAEAKNGEEAKDGEEAKEEAQEEPAAEAKDEAEKADEA